MDLNWDGIREVEKFIQSFGAKVEEGLHHVDLLVIEIESGPDLSSKLVELLLVEVLAMKGKIPGKKPKSIPSNFLKRYFCSNCNADNLGTLWMPKKTIITPLEVLILASIGSFSCSNPEELISTSIASSSRSNPVVKLICPGGLPDLTPLPKELEEVINLDVEDELAKKKKSYESHHKFEDSWVAKTPWIEMIVGVDKEYHNVKCMICSVVTEHVKLLAPKLDTISKHAGRWKAKKDLPHLGVKEREFYVSENCKHAANTRFYKTRSKDSVELFVVKGMKGERSRKQIQFAFDFSSSSPRSSYAQIQRM